MRLPSDSSTLANLVKQGELRTRQLARQHSELLLKQLEDVAATAQEIAEGGDAYLVGIREIALRLTLEATQLRLNIGALLQRF